MGDYKVKVKGERKRKRKKVRSYGYSGNSVTPLFFRGVKCEVQLVSFESF